MELLRVSLGEGRGTERIGRAVGIELPEDLVSTAVDPRNSRVGEAFDKAGTSFVSVTQSFNTTTSMGRLTLNMLLSFAQFEREVTAERIRDKIAASKAKGMWMGGTPPLGFEPSGRTLAIVDEHANIIRDIYRRYAELGNVRLVAEQLVRDGIRSPERTSGAGRRFGGRQFTRGQIYHMLKNPIYVGDIEHRGETHAGQHPAIIDRALWNDVQERLKINLRGERRIRSANPSPLSGKLFDQNGEPLIPVHACKGKVRYRYYVSRALQHDGTVESTTGIRVPAREIEAHVAELIVSLVDDPATLAARLRLDASEYPTIAPRCDAAAQNLRQRNQAAADLAAMVRLLPDRIEVDVSTAGIAAALGTTATDTLTTVTLTADVQLRRSRGVMRIVREDGRSGTVLRPQTSLINLVAKAHSWWKQLARGEKDIAELARLEGVSASYVTRVVRLAFLAPGALEAILHGRQRAGVTSTGLMIGSDFPMLWSAQAGLI